MIKKMLPMLEVEYVVLHCSATRCDRPFTFEDLDRCHRARGYNGCGYHYYVTRDGEIHLGRPEEVAGAHARHYNQHAIGVCYEGGLNPQGRDEDTRTPAQKASLHYLLKSLKLAYPQAKIIGHRDLPNVHKACPCLDAQREYADINNL